MHASLSIHVPAAAAHEDVDARGFVSAFLGVAMLPTATTAEPAPAAIEFNGRPLDAAGRAELRRVGGGARSGCRPAATGTTP
jgi:hypothetical protein